jgi:phosphohistidine phosphatase SixA
LTSFTRRAAIGHAALFAAAMLVAPAAAGAEVLDAALVKSLRQGGYVLVMRHASSPAAPPARADADPRNVGLERELDASGRAGAAAVGDALRKLGVAVGTVWCSPTFRARQTASLAGWASPAIADELGDRGVSMQAASGDQASWLRARAAEIPARGTVTVIVTHYPNLSAAFGEAAAGMADGEMLVFRPEGGAPAPVGRIKPDEWIAMANRP